MRCHYEVLGVGFDASDAELKKAYRKAALKWHPDKNRDNLEEATQEFQLIQAAYAVLSDPHERAWYDDHRESILRGGDGEDGGGAGEGMDLMRYFSPSCFRGYGDDDGGFYKVYAEVFDRIWENELYVVEGDSPPPPFGDADSDYDKVAKPFYRYWTNFSTANTFAGVDKWDTREAPNRQVKRLMEKENKKLRDNARKEHTQTVRQLASFVRSLDRQRKMRHDAAVAVEREKARMDREATAEAERQQRISELDAMLAAEQSRQDWSAMEEHLEAIEDQIDAEFGAADGVGIGGAASESGSSRAAHTAAPQDEWECVACSKRFKSEKQWANHQRSKKHLAAVAELKRYMEDDDEAFAAAFGDDDNGGGGGLGSDPLGGAGGGGCLGGAAEGDAVPLPDDFDADEDVAPASDDELAASDGGSGGSGGSAGGASGSGGGCSDEDDDADDDDVLARMMRGMHARPSAAGGGGGGGAGAAVEAADDMASDHAGSSDGDGDADADGNTAELGAGDDASAANGADDDDDGGGGGGGAAGGGGHSDDAAPTKGPRRKKKRKGPQRGATAGVGPSPLLPGGATGDAALLCQVCSEEFDTRNKLFRHVEATGHAVLKDVSSGGGGKGKKGKKKKR